MYNTSIRRYTIFQHVSNRPGAKLTDETSSTKD